MAEVMGIHSRFFLFLLKNCTDTHWQDSCGKDHFFEKKKTLIEIGWAKVPNCECLFVQRKQGLFLSVYVDDMIGWKEAEFSSYVEEVDEERLQSGTNIISLSRLFRLHSKGMQTKRENQSTILQDV